MGLSTQMASLAIVLALTTLSPVVAETEHVTVALERTNCLFGCFDALTTVSYADIPLTAGYYDGYCNSTIFTTSIYACIDKYCTQEEQDLGWAKLVGYCEEYGEVTLGSMDEVKSLIHGTVEEFDTVGNPGTMINGTIVPTAQDAEDGLRTEVVWNKTWNIHHAFGWSMYLLFGFTILCAMGDRAYEALHNRLGIKGDDSHRAYRQGSTWWKKHVTVPALFGKRHAEPWSICSLPTRMEAIQIFVYVAINLIFTCVGYDIFPGNLYWADSASQIARYLADRTGIMSFYNLPLLWCLAGRNDVFLWLTGWSYSTASMFHRWVAWITTIQAIIHSAAWTWIERDVLAYQWPQEYWRTGVGATVAMSLLLILSIRPFRQRFYEIFLLLHISLAMMCLVLLFYHVKIFDGEYDAWLWACVACWVLDRFLRLARMITLSFRAFSTSSSGRNTRAVLAYRDSGLIRLTVKPSIPLSPKPGQYYYLYTPWSLTPWENHPFTLASWSDGNLHFLVGPQSGATRRLQRRMQRECQGIGEEREMDMRLYLEGPYGQTHNLAVYDHVLLVAGGSGITAILPYVYTLQAKSHVQVTVVWAVGSRDYAADVMGKELAGVPVKLYVTRETVEGKGQAIAGQDGAVPRLPTLSPTASESSALHEQTSTEGSSYAEDSTTKHQPENKEAMTGTVINGRPVMKELVDGAVDSLIGGDRLAVLACGPGQMMDDLRAAVVQAYDRVSGSQLTYFEDSFGW